MNARYLLITLLLAGAQAACAAQQQLPADVRAFSDRREACDYFRGEPWDMGDAPEIRQRREFIFAKVKRLCRGTDRQLSALRRKYSGNAGITARLRDYETIIETP